jgi:Helicase HerA, central domain
MTDFEKLGVFYLGRVHDPDTGKTTEEPLLYDAKDLTTHAVCVGMTGSGKTGLGIDLIEEAAIDGIPAIVIDPKGDMGNLLLTFPELSASSFRPWVDEGEAARKQLTPDAYAEKTASSWKSGIESWGQDSARIARLREAVDFAIYTPGSKAGLPLSILSSLDAPPAGFVDDAAAMRDRVASAVSGLLALAGIEADPIQSREHILLSKIVDRDWRAGKNLDLLAVIHAVQEPGLDRIGVLPLESFFPTKARLTLAMQLNNLAASPSFTAWTEGEPLNIQRLLYTKEGRPRVSVLSISHLSDAERMFFVTVLLNEVLAWTRRQTGTSTLRAMLYMDEIFGYFPPTANPPAKAPMLTLLKQARAFGVGIVLSTQNPVDLDYRGLSNAGTWFIGRLQTERDKSRVIEGLTSASAGEGLDRAELDHLMANLGDRVFLMRNVHEDAPVLFETRWCLSYLRGPLSPAQMGDLMKDHKAALPEPVTMAAPTAAGSAPATAAPAASPKTVLPSSIDQVYLRPKILAPGTALTYRPAFYAAARLHFADGRRKLDAWQPVRHLVPAPSGSGLLWSEARVAPEALDSAPAPEAVHEPIPAELSNAKAYAKYEKAYKAYLLENNAMNLMSIPEHKVASEPGETEEDFRIRAGQQLREEREAQMEKLRKKFAVKAERLVEKGRKAVAKIEKEKAQVSSQHMRTLISFGTAALSVFLGRKAGGLGRASTGIGSISRTRKEKLDVTHAKQALEVIQQQQAALEQEAQKELDRLAKSFDPAHLQLKSVRIAPRKADTSIQQLGVVWIPYAADAFGSLRPAVDL